jgi:peptidoglycan hydrolase-like protein with peptidoglycan-binding domain
VGTKIRTGVEIAKAGQWDTSTGKWTCTPAQIASAVRAFASGKFRKPVVKAGHRDPRFDGEPALGTVVALRASEDGATLLGDVEIPDWLDDVLPTAFPSRSIESLLGVETADGEKFDMVTTGLALLGVTPPAIQSLADLEQAVTSPVVEFVAAMAVTATAGTVTPEVTPDAAPVAPAPAEPEPVAAAGVFTEALHPRQGGKFAAKGSGYTGAQAGKKPGQTTSSATVKALQQRLMRLGFLPRTAGKNGNAVDGLFGPKTEAALKAYQKSKGLKPTGHIATNAIGKIAPASGNLNPKNKSKPGGSKPHMRRGRKVNAGAVTGETLALACLTSRSPLDTGQPLIASGRGRGSMSSTDSLQEIRMADLPTLRERLGLPDDTDEAAVLAAAVAALDEQPEPDAGNPAPELVAASAEQVDALVDARVQAAIQAAMSPVLAELTKVTEQQAARNKADAEATRERVIAAALADGKILPTERGLYAEQYDAAPTVVTAILEAKAAGSAFPVHAAGHVGAPDPTVEDEYKALTGALFGGEQA